MDVLSLINDVADDVAVASTKNEESYMYAKRYEGIDIETLRKLISDTPVLPRPAPSYTFAEFRQPTPESPLTATEIMDQMRVFRNGTGLLSVPRRTWQDEVQSWLDQQTLDDISQLPLRSLPLQPLRLEPEPEPYQPYQEMRMRDNPRVVRW